MPTTKIVTSAELLPEEIRGDWQRYLDSVVEDIWARPALAPRNRSLVTITCLAVLRCSSELDINILRALKNGLSRLELCETMMQVSGYAGMGVGVEGFKALRAVFERETDLGADPSDLPKAIEGTRLERARYIQTYLTEHVDIIFKTLTPYPESAAPEDRPPFHAGRKEWLGWLTENAFGDLWSRPNLALREREFIVCSVLIVLGRREELRSHFAASLRFGITPEEMTEALIQIAIYAGYPTMVSAIQLYSQVLAEHGLAAPIHAPE